MADAQRDLLPDRRRGVTQKAVIMTAGGNRQTVHYSIGLYPDGRPGELFIDVGKAGAALRGWVSESAMMISIALQHGSPLWTILSLFVGSRNDPHGAVEGHDRITKCTSIMDLIARDLAITFLKKDDMADTERWTLAPVPICIGTELPLPIEGQTCNCTERVVRQTEIQ
jgi:ribonucleoside-diphosphate reductase alpha chain